MENEEKYLNEENKELLLVYGEIFYQLIQRPWFKEIIDTRVDIRKNIDHEAKRVDIVVVEVPTEETMRRLAEIEKEKAKSGPQIIAPTAVETTKILSGS